MRTTGPRIFLLLTLLAPLPATAANPAENAAENAEARRVVQQFYDWYAATVNANVHEIGYAVALKKKGSMFSPALAGALRKDLEAGKGDDGLDFDPILCSQDPCDHYEVGRVTWKDGTWRAEIYGICARQRSPKPHVVAALTHTPHGWQFVNFYYPVGGDLLETLEHLHPETH